MKSEQWTSFYNLLSSPQGQSSPLNFNCPIAAMRLMYTIALVTAVALCPSSALPVGNFKEITKNAVLPDLIEQRNTEGQHLLRRNNLVDNDDMDEERGFDIKKVPVGNFKEITKNAVLPDLIEQRNTEGQRLLRRNNLDDNDDMDEERGFDIKKVASKLNPVTAAKKSAAQVAKAKEALKDATDYQKMIDAANRIVRGD
ncbi:hypothetical protein PHMEG_00013515 [Phytophthora megakarya]|uniref:RxLR effector protein n=1 Tax=Phytophthora megakarya TaxID=4795 RepID=A0A225W655_9STRA|nr:hypothetical protein PHMEG_00013515 [Phytophthora megakarya]